jgi:hypothetical protein
MSFMPNTQFDIDYVTGVVRPKKRNPWEVDIYGEDDDLLANASAGPVATPAPVGAPPISTQSKPPSRLDELEALIRQRPERGQPNKWQSLAAAATGALGGWYAADRRNNIGQDQIGRATDAILNPGYDRRRQEWEDQVGVAKMGVDLEGRRAQEQRALAEEGRRTAESDAELEWRKAQTARAGMPPAPKMPQTYEAYLVQKLQSSDPSEKAWAEKKITELKAKPAQEKNLVVRDYVNENTGEATILFYDPITGNLVKEEKKPKVAEKRPRAPREASPTQASTLDYRQKQRSARVLAGKASQQFPNDKAAARDWISKQSVSDPEVLQMALDMVGAPPAKSLKEKALERFMGGGASPTTPSAPKAADPAGIR